MESTEIVHNEYSFLNKRDVTLFTQSWEPVDEMEAAVILIHGYAEHSGRYGHLAKFLNSSNIGLFAMDLAGHGKSEGNRADIVKFEHYVDDISIYVEKIEEQLSLRPVFLMGHSMGASIAIQYAARHRFELSGLILTAPPLKTFSTIPKVIQEMARYVSAIAATVPVISMDPEMLSRDSNVIQEYNDDPLVYHGRIRARMAQQMVEGGKQALSVADKLILPVWAGHGTEDRIAHPDGTRMFIDTVKSEDKKYRYYGGLYHDILHEPEMNEVIFDIMKWIELQLNPESVKNMKEESII